MNHADGSLACAFCEGAGEVVVDGVKHVCSSCLGLAVSRCVLCGERATHYDEGTDPRCETCRSTIERNEAA